MIKHEETHEEDSFSDILGKMLIQQISAQREWTLNASGSPHLPFCMEKTDLYFIGLHTWKKFTPYA